jgi:hypothetical protein
MLSFWKDIEVEQLIPSLQGLADKIVAADGAYEGTPGATAKSSPALHKRIRQLCKRAGIGLELIVPDAIYRGETEKRNVLIQRAAKGATWVFPADADWVFSGDRAGLREHLGLTRADVVFARMHTPVIAEMEDVAPHPWHLQVAGKTINYPVFYRVLPGLRIEGRHWWYLAEKDGGTIALKGGPKGMPSATEDKEPGIDFLIEHRCFYRDPERLAARKEFYDRRDGIVAETGEEP